MPYTAGSRFLKTDYPFEEGLSGSTTKLSESAILIPDVDLLQNSVDNEGLNNGW